MCLFAAISNAQDCPGKGNILQLNGGEDYSNCDLTGSIFKDDSLECTSYTYYPPEHDDGNIIERGSCVCDKFTVVEPSGVNFSGANITSIVAPYSESFFSAATTKASAVYSKCTGDQCGKTPVDGACDS